MATATTTPRVPLRPTMKFDDKHCYIVAEMSTTSPAHFMGILSPLSHLSEALVEFTPQTMRLRAFEMSLAAFFDVCLNPVGPTTASQQQPPEAAAAPTTTKTTTKRARPVEDSIPVFVQDAPDDAALPSAPVEQLDYYALYDAQPTSVVLPMKSFSELIAASRGCSRLRMVAVSFTPYGVVERILIFSEIGSRKSDAAVHPIIDDAFESYQNLTKVHPMWLVHMPSASFLEVVLSAVRHANSTSFSLRCNSTDEFTVSADGNNGLLRTVTKANGADGVVITRGKDVGTPGDRVGYRAVFSAKLFTGLSSIRNVSTMLTIELNRNFPLIMRFEVPGMGTNTAAICSNTCSPGEPDYIDGDAPRVDD